MTTVALLASPPTEESLPALRDAGVLDGSDAKRLARALVADLAGSVRASGADLLVNYPASEDAPESVDDPEAALREVLAEAFDVAPDALDARFEVQVGSTHSARVGNAVTHLLEREGVTTAAATTPGAALLSRKAIDQAAMQLRSSPVVLAPSTAGGVAYAAFREPVDFTDAYDPPAVETLTERAAAADLGVATLDVVPRVDTVDGLHTAVPILRARRLAGEPVPARTADVLSSLDLDLSWE